MGKTLHPTPHTLHPAPRKNFFSRPQLVLDRLKWSKLTYLLAHVSPRQHR
ncbi:hypothetical protein PN482_12550 [Microcystis aeruginosa CS-555/01A07]|nr:hypothetical protein [Microcystis aeruginosa]MDB9429703.1 hypothetical protein [Microcystis aeruginosa CS-555/01A07]